MARQLGRGKCVPLLPLLPEHISPGSQLEAGHHPGRSCSWFQFPTSAAATQQDSGHHHNGRAGRGVPCVRRTRGSSVPAFRRTARDALGRTELYRKPHRRKTFFPPRKEAQSVISPPREPPPAAAAKWRAEHGGWEHWEVEAQKATLRIRQSTRKSQTKLHICREVILIQERGSVRT